MRVVIINATFFIRVLSGKFNVWIPLFKILNRERKHHRVSLKP